MECNKGFFWLLKHFSKGHTNPSASWVFSMLSQVLYAAKSLQAGSSLKCGKWLMCNLLKPTFYQLFRLFHDLILDVFVRLVSDFLVSSGQGVKDNFHIRCQSKTSEAAEVGNHRQTESLHRSFHVVWSFFEMDPRIKKILLQVYVNQLRPSEVWVCGNFFLGSLSWRKPSVLLRRRRRNKGISMLCCRAGLLGARNGSEFHVCCNVVFWTSKFWQIQMTHIWSKHHLFWKELPSSAGLGGLILWSFDQHQFFSWLILFAASGRYAHSGGWGAPQGVRPFLLKKKHNPPICASGSTKRPKNQVGSVLKTDGTQPSLAPQTPPMLTRTRTCPWSNTPSGDIWIRSMKKDAPQTSPTICLKKWCL